MRFGPMSHSRYLPFTVFISILLLFQMLAVPEIGLSLKPLISLETGYSPHDLVGNIKTIGDFDRDGYVDAVMTMPKNSSNGLDSGCVCLFWGSKNGFPAFEPFNADIVLVGEKNYLFGQDVAAWDYAGDNWNDLVIGCPGALNGTGKVLVYESSDINIAIKGSVIDTNLSTLELDGNNTHFFGSHLEVGDMTGDGLDDLIVLSTRSDTLVPRFEMFSGGVVSDQGYEIELPPDSVSNSTRTEALDVYGSGRDAFIYSSPDHGRVRIIQMNVSYESFSLPGANSTGVVDFNGSIYSTGNTWGWGAGDDGWDTSPAHVYDQDSGYDSVRYNQGTGNARGHNRSIEQERELFMEVGGILSGSNNRDMSGAYGVSFHLSGSNVTGINSVVLSFDWKYEDWGFENSERLWIKSRLTDSSGTVHWLGHGRDRPPSPDTTPEIYTRPGVGDPGQILFGSGHFSSDILSLINGPGEYYLDLGGKISRWTTSTEFGGFGFDNITLVFRTLSHDIKLITGSSGLGSGMLSADADADGKDDLLLGSPIQGTVSIFKGSQPYWLTLSGINQDMDNTTIEGIPATGLGTSMAHIAVSPFTIFPSLAIAAPGEVVDASSLGRIYVFEVPLSNGTIQVSSAREKNDAPEGFKYYGWRVLSVGDHDMDSYPEVLVISWTWDDDLRTTLTDRSPSYPLLWILDPKRHEVVSGNVEIRARVWDLDGDVEPENVRFYRSMDNRSWNPIGDGTPDRTEGDVAIKYWNTTFFENAGYFLRVTVTDRFGLRTEKFTDRVDVLNHAPPVVKLIYPADGTELRWTEHITAKVLIPSGEELDPPVRFLYSRDNITWTEFANLSVPMGGSPVDYMTEFNTELYPDGPIWFKINASTLFGLGSEARNTAPVFINNFYPPGGEFIRPYSNSTISGIFNVTIRASDPDNDIEEPIQLFLKTSDEETWSFLANMTRGPNGTFYHRWNTTMVENGEYDLSALLIDSTNLQVELSLNGSIWIHNLYVPSVRLTTLSDGDVISGLKKISALISDRDMNIPGNGVRFLFRPAGLDIWNSMGRSTLRGNVSEVLWDTASVSNGIYDIRVEVTDLDNLTAMFQVTGVRVKNICPPEIEPDLPPFHLPVSGVVRLRFNVTDDEPISPENIIVEVWVLDAWVRLENVTREEPGGIFTPGMKIAYHVDWHTTMKDGDGNPLFPDSIGYDIRITVIDSDGEKAVYRSPVSYHVENGAAPPPDDDVTQGIGLPGWSIAVLVVFILLVLIIIFMVFVLRGDRKTREPIPQVSGKMGVRGSVRPDEEVMAPVKGEESAIYSPPGWGSEPVSEPVGEEPMFAAGAETPGLGLDLGLGEEEEFEDLSSKRDLYFGLEPEKAPGRVAGKVKKAPRMEGRRDTGVDVELPEGVMPASTRIEHREEEETEEEDWEEVEGWEEEEEEELEEEDMEDLGEEDWEEVDDEWEDLKEEGWEEEPLVVTCKCGEEIEIPPDFKGTRFRCPSCGRMGRIPGR